MIVQAVILATALPRPKDGPCPPGHSSSGHWCVPQRDAPPAVPRTGGSWSFRLDLVRTLLRGIKATMKRPKALVRIDKDELSKRAGVEFHWSDIPILVEVTSDYIGRFRDRETLPDFMLDASCKPEHEASDKEARRAFVHAVEGVWRFRAHQVNPAKYSGLGAFPVKGLGARYNPLMGKSTGPMVDLLLYLLRAAGEPKPQEPDTLFHDLKALAILKERSHSRADGSKPWPARKVRQPGP